MITKLLELLDTALSRTTCLVAPGVAVLLELLDTALSRATCLLVGHDDFRPGCCRRFACRGRQR